MYTISRRRKKERNVVSRVSFGSSPSRSRLGYTNSILAIPCPCHVVMYFLLYLSLYRVDTCTLVFVQPSRVRRKTNDKFDVTKIISGHHMYLCVYICMYYNVFLESSRRFYFTDRRCLLNKIRVRSLPR